MANGFSSKGSFADAWICFKHDSKRNVKKGLRSLLGRTTQAKFHLKQRYSEKQAKELVRKSKLALDEQGNPSWFYTAFERQDADPLTNYTLDFIEKKAPKGGRALVTGCGPGIMVFHLAELGFKEVVGTDLLDECIFVADRLRKANRYDNVRFQTDDGFAPSVEGTFDVITALHWVFSAWMGNYGNAAVGNPYDPQVREKALSDFLKAYAPKLNPNGMLFVELTDACTDYRLPADHFMGDYSKQIYPIRHSPSQVEACAKAQGFEVVDKQMSVSYGHHPRTSYCLRKL